MFITVQIVSFATIGLIMWLLWFLIFAIPVEIREPIYWLIRDSGLLGPNAIWVVYAIISLVLAQQIIKATMSVPISSEAEPPDVDHIFPAPLRAHVFYGAKYLRSIPRRLLFYFYVALALIPILFFLIQEFGLNPVFFPIFMLVVFLLGEIGSIATHGVYCLRKLVAQPRPLRRVYRGVFILGMIIGSLLLLIPFFRIGNLLVPSLTFTLAQMLVALGTQGALTELFLPALPGMIIGLTIALVTMMLLSMWLTNKIELDFYEDLATVTQRQGTALGFLAKLPIEYNHSETPFRAVLKKDIISGLRKPGKTFYVVGIVANLIFAFFFVNLLPMIQTIFPLPPEFNTLIPSLYALLLVIITPLMAITAADPFQGEFGALYLLRLAPIAPIKVTFIKYLLLIVTPALLSIPFAIYFAVILGSLELLLVAVAVLPHAIILSTAIGIALGSRYPFATRAKTETPVALMITYPVLSWLAMIPAVILLIGFLEGGPILLLFGSVFVIPYSIGLTLILLSWAAHSYLRQE